MKLYDINWATGQEIYKFADAKEYDPVVEFDKKWLKESFMRAGELFFYDKELQVEDWFEADLLHNMWPFVYRAYQDKVIRACLGERCSVAVSLARNEDRSLEAIEKRPRKAVGAKLDILLKSLDKEIGSAEVGKQGVTIADDKYLDDGLFKLPKTLRDMLALLVQSNPTQKKQLVHRRLPYDGLVWKFNNVIYTAN